MLDELKDDQVIRKVGGRFKLSTLMQKRLVQLNAGARPLVDLDTKEKMQIVVQEILHDKIYLDAEMNVQISAAAQEAGPPELDFNNL